MDYCSEYSLSSSHEAANNIYTHHGASLLLDGAVGETLLHADLLEPGPIRAQHCSPPITAHLGLQR